jgi:O-methyltransferase involved in polyketide biosynthesis
VWPGRALESRRPGRLFDDPFAQALAGEDGFRWTEEMRPPGAPAENPSIGSRTWFFDELIIRAASDGLRQAALLAAGDTGG